MFDHWVPLVPVLVYGLGFICFVGFDIIAPFIECQRSNKRARQALEDYMRCRDLREFFKSQRTRKLKEDKIVFDDCLEEESARLVSSRVL